MTLGIESKAGELRVTSDGHVLIKVISHPAYGTCYVQRAWVVWWRYRKQRVSKGWVLHHKDEDSANDKVGNLQLLTHAEHSKLHALMKHADGRLGISTWADERRKKASLAAKQQHLDGNLGPVTWTQATYDAISSKKGRKH